MRRTQAIHTIIATTFVIISVCCGQANLTWLGNSTCWDEPTNWDSGWVPTNLDNVTIPSGLTYYPNLTYITLGPKYCVNMYIAPGGVLNFYDGGNAVLEVSGNWLNEGTLNPATGTVRLVDSTPCSIYTDIFYRLENNKFYVTPFGIISGHAYLMGDVSILAEITFEYGTLNCSNFELIGLGVFNSFTLNNGHLKWGRAAFTNTFENVTFDTGMVEFYGTNNQTVPSAHDLHHLTLSGSGIKTLTGNVIVAGNIRVADGVTFETDGCRIDLGRDLNIANGTFQMGDESILTLDGGRISLSHGCIFSAVGTGIVDTGPIVTKHPATLNYYQFDIWGQSAVISASYATFEYMDLMGIDLDSAAIVDPAHPMDHCTFQHGDPTSYSSALIHIDNNQEITIPYANFPVIGATNVRKEVDYGRATFLNATGIFAGEAYEVDFFDRIDWVEGIPPVAPLVTIERDDNSVILLWNTVSENTAGDPIVVDSYKVYSDSAAQGAFIYLEAEVTAPDTTWTDLDVLNIDIAKFYRVTAIDN